MGARAYDVLGGVQLELVRADELDGVLGCGDFGFRISDIGLGHGAWSVVGDLRDLTNLLI
jgi:hypothetical protein